MRGTPKTEVEPFDNCGDVVEVPDGEGGVLEVERTCKRPGCPVCGPKLTEDEIEKLGIDPATYGLEGGPA